MTGHVHRLAIGRAQITVFASAEELFAAAAGEFANTVTQAPANACSIALSGGSTPRSLYKLIAERAVSDGALRSIGWRNVHLFFGDERCVPPNDEQSNYRMVRESLLSNAALGAAHVHRIHAELPPAQAAQEYEADLKQHFSESLPRFDLVLLGLGYDGHTASLFPGTAALVETTRWVVANEVPQQKSTRITLTFPVLNNAAKVMFLVSGADKSNAMAATFDQTSETPASRVQPSGELLWFADAAAARDLLKARQSSAIG